MKKELIKISVGLRLGPEELAEIEDRKNRIEKILTAEGGTFEVSSENKKNFLEIVYRADVPVLQANKHHAFDSRLNKSWPEGAGAAWVEEI